MNIEKFSVRTCRKCGERMLFEIRVMHGDQLLRSFYAPPEIEVKLFESAAHPDKVVG